MEISFLQTEQRAAMCARGHKGAPNAFTSQRRSLREEDEKVN